MIKILLAVALFSTSASAQAFLSSLTIKKYEHTQPEPRAKTSWDLFLKFHALPDTLSPFYEGQEFLKTFRVEALLEEKREENYVNILNKAQWNLKVQKVSYDAQGLLTITPSNDVQSTIIDQNNGDQKFLLINLPTDDDGSLFILDITANLAGTLSTGQLVKPLVATEMFSHGFKIKNQDDLAKQMFQVLRTVCPELPGLAQNGNPHARNAYYTINFGINYALGHILDSRQILSAINEARMACEK